MYSTAIRYSSETNRRRHDAQKGYRDFYTSKHLRNQDGQNPIKALRYVRRSSIEPQQPPDEVHSYPNILTFICHN